MIAMYFATHRTRQSTQGLLRVAMLALTCIALFACSSKPKPRATESGALSHRANLQFQAGHYTESYALFQRALGGCAKEADLSCEGRVLVNLGLIQMHAGEYDKGLELLSKARVEHLEPIALQSLHLARIQLLNMSLRHKDAWDYWSSIEAGMQNSDVSKSNLISLLSEAAVSASGNGDASKSQSLLGQATELSDESMQGLMLFSQARCALLLKKNAEAKEQFTNALEISRKQKRNWHSGTILTYLGDIALADGHKKEATDHYRRASALFEQLGLLRPYLYAAEALLRLSPEDKALSIRIEQAKDALSAPTAQSSIVVPDSENR